MQQCMHLARRAAGLTAPNPLVGATIIQKSQCIGQGFHPKAGEPHAEIFALREAGERARGATLYVNLEPCNHTGRTPPCTTTILQAGIARVVVGMVDPNPLVAGSGIKRLRQAGIDVTVGVEEAACHELNEAFVHRIGKHLPFGILKYAMTLDGKIATVSGHSQWVSGAAARQMVHAQRGFCDAVVVGGNTVRQDDPQLTCRLVAGRNPLRVVLSRRLDMPTTAQLWDTSTAPTLVLTEPTSGSHEAERQLLMSVLAQRGVEVTIVPKLTPRVAAEELYHRGHLATLWECGGALAAAALQEGVIQKVMAFVAPKLVGGLAAPSPVGGDGVVSMGEAWILDQVRDRQVGSDRLIEGYLKQPSTHGKQSFRSG
jgi:diaminohydroxyphosphoribosylaminopyrimidine deaminase/5-amino-6-(5-phosphoribosylamino)uracil reductase